MSLYSLDIGYSSPLLVASTGRSCDVPVQFGYRLQFSLTDFGQCIYIPH